MKWLLDVAGVVVAAAVVDVCEWGCECWCDCQGLGEWK